MCLEPGRFIVAQAGVLLTRVTQMKGKGDVHYVGVGTGMNSLIRPALYDAHPIVNLTRLGKPATELVTVVGPICESATAGPIGCCRRHGGRCAADRACRRVRHAMTSRYNLREPAIEVLI